MSVSCFLAVWCIDGKAVDRYSSKQLGGSVQIGRKDVILQNEDVIFGKLKIFKNSIFLPFFYNIEEVHEICLGNGKTAKYYRKKKQCGSKRIESGQVFQETLNQLVKVFLSSMLRLPICDDATYMIYTKGFHVPNEIGVTTAHFGKRKNCTI